MIEEQALAALTAPYVLDLLDEASRKAVLDRLMGLAGVSKAPSHSSPEVNEAPDGAAPDMQATDEQPAAVSFIPIVTLDAALAERVEGAIRFFNRLQTAQREMRDGVPSAQLHVSAALFDQPSWGLDEALTEAAMERAPEIRARAAILLDQMLTKSRAELRELGMAIVKATF